MALSFCAVFLLPVVTLYFLYTGNIVTAIGTEVEDMISNDLTASVRLIDSNIQTLMIQSKCLSAAMAINRI